MAVERSTGAGTIASSTRNTNEKSQGKGMKVYLSRWVCVDVPSNFERLEEESAEAADVGADLVVFPELFLQGYAQRVSSKEASARFAELSGRHPGPVFVFGSIEEDRRNRVTVWQAGKRLAYYDKVHLFAPNGEHERWVAGDRYVAVRAGDWTLGLLNCNDIRFPEQARALTLAGRSHILVVPAWWPWRRDHIWANLLRARAYENGVWTVGCCVAACENSSERFAGAGNYVFDPLGEPVRTSDDHTYCLDRSSRNQVLVDPRDAYVSIKRVEVV